METQENLGTQYQRSCFIQAVLTLRSPAKSYLQILAAMMVDVFGLVPPLCS
jgi:hypothetical protein